MFGRVFDYLAMGRPYYLFFADDILLFREASVRQAGVVEQLLNELCQQSGQKVNLQKSQLLFSSNIPSTESSRLCRRGLASQRYET